MRHTLILVIGITAAACGSVSEPPEVDAPVAVDPCSDLDGVGCDYLVTEHPIGVIEGYRVMDQPLGRENPILVRYPTDATGPLPVVVWSHGGYFDDNGHRLGAEWGEAIAKNGWVVIHVAHTVPTLEQIQRMCTGARVPGAECTMDMFLAGGVARPRDVITLLDDLPAIDSLLHDRAGIDLDLDRVVIGGWSAGSQAPLVLAGAVRTIAPSVTRFEMPDVRPIAAVALSPQGIGFSGFFDVPGDNSWDGIAKPVLVLTGDNDFKAGNPDLLGGIRRQAWDNLAGGRNDQHLLFSTLPLGVGEHGTYNLGDAASSDVRLVRLSRALISTTRAFLDASIGNAAAQAYLASDLPGRLAGSETGWSTK